MCEEEKAAWREVGDKPTAPLYPLILSYVLELAASGGVPW